MDGRTLMEIMQSPNWSLVQPAVDAFNTTQQQNQATLQATLGQEQRAQQRQPLDLEHLAATTAATQANTRVVNNAENSRPPVADRYKEAMTKLHSSLNDTERDEEDKKVTRLGQLAALAKANGGSLPLSFLSKLSPEEVVHFASPKAIDTTLGMAKAWFETHPKTMMEKSKEAAATERARIAAGPGYARAAAGGSKQPKNPQELMTFYTMKANSSDDPEERAKWTELANAEWQKIQQKIILDYEARKAGNVDLSKTGSIATNPAPTLSSIPTPNDTQPQKSTLPNGWSVKVK